MNISKNEIFKNNCFINNNTMSQKQRILVIEDTESLQRLILRLLEDDYQTQALSEAKDALDVCKSFKPDLILLDIMLKGDIDGLSFLRSIKANNDLNHVPVILMSALAATDIVTDGLTIGANDYLIKPFDLKQLLLKIKNLLLIANRNVKKAILDKNIPFAIAPSHENSTIEKLNHILEEMITNDKHLSLVEVAKELNISQSTLTRLIKKKFGVTPNNYVMHRKLEKAKILIYSDKGIPIKEIAISLGFNSLAYFSNCYKKYFGHYPTATQKHVDK